VSAYSPRTCRVYRCKICGYVSKPFGTHRTIDKVQGDMALEEMMKHVQVEHSELVGEDADRPTLLKYFYVKIQRTKGGNEAK